MSNDKPNGQTEGLSEDLLLPQQVKAEISSCESGSPLTLVDPAVVPFQKSSSRCSDSKLVTMNRVTQAPTECTVCGLPTSCFHYEVSSCNGCKTFFRRTIIMGKKHECRFKNVCNIKDGSRCRACRFDQCIMSGMDPSAICFPKGFNEGTALQKVYARKRFLVEFAASKRAVILTKCTQQFEQTLESRIVDNLIYLETKFRRLRESNYNPRPYYQLHIRDLLRLACELRNADQYEKPCDWPLPISCFDCDFIENQKGNSTSCENRHWPTIDLFLNIEYLKALPFFEQLDLDDQVCLIMHVGLANTVLVQSWYSYLQNSRTVTLPDGRIPILNKKRKLALLGGFDSNVTQIEIDVFCKNIDPLYRVMPHPEEYCLLKTIIFCHAETPGLSSISQNILERHRRVYASTLLRRMQARMGTLPGAQKYAEVLTLIQTFFEFAQKKRELYVLISSTRLQQPEMIKKRSSNLFERFIISS